MELTEQQRATVEQWVAEGASLSEVQKRLQSEFQISLTYLDARLLVADMNLQLAEKAREKEKVEAAPAADEPAIGEEEIPDDFGDELLPPAGGAVSVSVDQIARIGTVVSGKVTFSDGEKSEWYLDQTGRLGLNASTPGYRPSEADIMAFQKELQRVMTQQGY